MSGYSWCWGRDFLAVALPAALLVAACGEGKLRGGESVSSTSLSLVTNTVSLKNQETDYSVNNVGVSITPRSAPFNKEPVPGSGKIIRGVLNFGGGAGNAVSFLWQRDAQKLFLDLNHDQDLADDPAGVFMARGNGPVNYQTFTNVHLLLTTLSGTCPVSADMIFWDFDARPSCTVALRCFWQGKLTLAGQDWQMGLVPNILNQADLCEDSQMLLRPWERRNQPFNAAGSSVDTFPFSQKLFFGGHAWQVNVLRGSQNGVFEPALQFAEQSVPLGDLKITGKFIRRLMLSGSPYLVVLDQPAEIVKVPVGNYRAPNVLLAEGGVEAACNLAQWQASQRISVSGKLPEILAVGGPLTNFVAVTRHGRDLRLDYQLIGAGGQTYQLADMDRSHPPSFAVFKDGRKIASGNFEFG